MKDWKVEMRGGGILLPEADLWCDPAFPAKRAFVSHAHFDHMACHELVICSEGTARLMRERLPAEREEWALAFGVKRALPLADGRLLSLTLVPAGHVFGSAQLLLEDPEGSRFLYSGDFKLRPGLSSEPCETPAADTLVMETTFGRPHYCFPPTETVIGAIARFCRQSIDDGAVPVLFGYSLGKSQELLRGVSGAGLPIMLHPQVAKMTRVYEELGMLFPPHRLFDEGACAGHVVIAPPQASQSSWLRKIIARRTAAVTGWAMDPGAIYRYPCDAAFPLSDHAGYDDLLRYVERIRPKRVLTVHGFAEEFARDLRQRGIEAWALGADNQMELRGFTFTSPSPPPAASEAATRQPANAAATVVSPDPAAFAGFCAAADRIRDTSSKLAKVTILQEYFLRLAPELAGQAAIYFTGRAFAQGDPRSLDCGWAILKRAVLGASGLTEADFRATYQRFRDSGETTAAVLEMGKPSTDAPLAWPLADMLPWFDALASHRRPTRKVEHVRARLDRLSANEAKYLVKIITGDLRIGLKEGLVEEAIAQTYGSDVARVREANMLTGDLAAVTHAAANRTLPSLHLRVFRPLQFMLASPEPTATAIVARLGERVWLEEKYDGIRCQIHKSCGRVELFSRELHAITSQFPDLAASAAAGLRHDVVADGELLAWQGGRALPFAELQKRLGRRGGDLFLGAEIPVSLWLYDLLWIDGETLLNQPLERRRARLEAIGLPSPDGRVQVAPRQWACGEAEIEAAFETARRRGNEGLMAKDPQSAYAPGRRGLAWLKLKKAFATLDVVVVGAEWGHGKRRGVLSDVTFAVRDDDSGELLTIGKAYSGLTDAEIAALTDHFLEHTIEDHGRYRTVVPHIVLEVAFDAVRPSRRHASGYALRFPRIHRIRDDKTPAAIDTLAQVKRLAARE
jgi:DNA ligase-1